jgi:glyoxylase-like metal-dependent hydrolase (beta-lactamase superfamily II)
MLSKIGKWKIIAIESGNFKLDGGAMMGSVPKVLWNKTNPADKLNRIDLAMRCVLLDDGENIVLIETGIGNKFDTKFSSIFEINNKSNTLSDTLQLYGYIHSNVTHVIMTHLHFDHSGGATTIDDNGELITTFPNAKYYISNKNWLAALNPNLRDKASYLKENFIPIELNGQLELIEGNTEILPGLSTHEANGHTSGQQLVKIDSMGETLLFCGDLIPLRSHLNPPFIMGYDLNASKTLEEKIDLLDLASKNEWWLWFYHDPKTIAVKVRKNTNSKYEVIKEVLKSN